MGKINPFGREVSTRTAMDILQESFGIGIKDYDRGADQWDSESGTWAWVPNITQECVVEFTVNEGKGTGKQTIPANEFRDYVKALQNIIESDFREPEGADRTTYVPTDVVAAQSFKMVYPRSVGSDGKVYENKNGERNVVSIRCTGGKGAKPMMIPQDQFAGVVGMLRRIADNLPQYEAQAWQNASGE
jgi:hypothetical protein